MAKSSNQYAILAGQGLQKLKTDFHNLALILNDLSQRIEEAGKLIEESEMEKKQEKKHETPSPGFLELQEAFNKAAEACENSAPSLEEIRKREKSYNIQNQNQNVTISEIGGIPKSVENTINGHNG